MNIPKPDTDPDYYEKPLSEESQSYRVYLETKQELLEDQINEESSPIKVLMLRKQYERIDQQLSWQGADPRQFTRKELTAVCNQHMHVDPVEDKYRSKVKSPATAIRAYCVSCMGGSVVGVKDCQDMTCPLWNFRMGKDPLRGFSLPAYLTPLSDSIPEEDEDDQDLFSDGEDEADDEDAKE